MLYNFAVARLQFVSFVTIYVYNIIDILRQRSRPYLFSNSLAPAIVSASIKVLELLNNTNSLLNKLNEKFILILLIINFCILILSCSSTTESSIENNLEEQGEISTSLIIESNKIYSMLIWDCHGYYFINFKFSVCCNK